MTRARTRSWRTPNSCAIWEASGVATIPAYNWFDLAASYTFRNGIKLTAGVNNILDEEPPLYWGGYALLRSARTVRLLERAVQFLAPSTVAVFVAPTSRGRWHDDRRLHRRRDVGAPRCQAPL